MLRDFVARYRQAHPEVDVQFLDIRSREVLDRLRAERNRPQADLWARADFRQPRFEKWYAQRPAPHEEEAKRFYEFVTTPESPV